MTDAVVRRCALSVLRKPHARARRGRGLAKDPVAEQRVRRDAAVEDAEDEEHDEERHEGLGVGLRERSKGWSGE